MKDFLKGEDRKSVMAMLEIIGYAMDRDEFIVLELKDDNAKVSISGNIHTFTGVFRPNTDKGYFYARTTFNGERLLSRFFADKISFEELEGLARSAYGSVTTDEDVPFDEFEKEVLANWNDVSWA